MGHRTHQNALVLTKGESDSMYGSVTERGLGYNWLEPVEAMAQDIDGIDAAKVAKGVSRVNRGIYFGTMAVSIASLDGPLPFADVVAISTYGVASAYYTTTGGIMIAEGLGIIE